MDELFERLKARATRTFGVESVELTVKRVRAIVGPVRFGRDGVEESDLVQAADAGLEALRSGKPPTPAQFKALQIMIRLARPSIRSRRGELDSYPVAPGQEDPLGDERKEDWEVFRQSAKPLLYSVGRIDANEKPMGTGFVVEPGLLLTNRHVLEQISFGTMMLDAGQAEVHFGEEDQTVNTQEAVPIQSVVAWHATLDLALLEIPADPDRSVFTFRATPPEPGETVVAVGYPMHDPLNSPDMMERIFEGRYEIKRAAPGEVLDAEESSIHHDCSTLGGNSGSPLLALDSAEVIGVHSNGFFTWRNEGIAGPAAHQFVAHRG